MREMDERRVGEVHGPVTIANHQGVQRIQVIIGDGGDGEGPRPDKGPRLLQSSRPIGNLVEDLGQDGCGGHQG